MYDSLFFFRFNAFLLHVFFIVDLACFESRLERDESQEQGQDELEQDWGEGDVH